MVGYVRRYRLGCGVYGVGVVLRRHVDIICDVVMVGICINTIRHWLMVRLY